MLSKRMFSPNCTLEFLLLFVIPLAKALMYRVGSAVGRYQEPFTYQRGKPTLRHSERNGMAAS